MEKNSTDALLGSFTSAVGLALGELLLLSARPEELGRCLAAIETTTYATLLSSDLRNGATSPSGRSLASAALRVLRAWYEEPDDLANLGETIRVLEEVLGAMGVRYVPAPFYEACSNK